MAQIDDPDMVRALLTEREGYVRRKLPERVAQVDEQLRLRGYQVAAQDRAQAAQDDPAAATRPPRAARRAPRERR